LGGIVRFEESRIDRSFQGNMDQLADDLFVIDDQNGNWHFVTLFRQTANESEHPNDIETDALRRGSFVKDC